MDYKVKIKIGNIEIGEAKDVSQKTPFITDIKVKSSTSMSALGIGSSASDALYFTMMNPYQVSYDGEKVELFISPQADTSLDDLGKIIDEVGSDKTDSAIDNTDVTAVEEDEEEGEQLTPEEEAESEEQESEDIEALHTFFEGEADVIADVTTEEEEEAEWRKLGSFYVFAQTNSSADNSIKFECYDAFSMLGADFSPTETTATIQELYDDLQEQIYDHFGIVVDDYEFDADVNEEIEWDIFCSYRDAIGYFAGLEGGYAVIGADDTLGISFFTYNDTILLDNVLIKYNETSAGDTVIEAFECNRSVNPYKEDLISVGSGQSIRFNNPLMTDTALEKIYDMYHGIRFSGAEVSMLWNENIQCGEFVRIMSPDEYASYLMLNNALADEEDPGEQLRLKGNMNSLGRVILVNNQTIDFTADAISAITSICRTEYAASNKVLSPKDAAFRNLYAEMIAAKYINAVKVVTDGLEAEDAHVKELVANNIDTDRLKAAIIDAGAITAEYAEAHYADISFANVNTAHVSEAWVKELMIQGQLISQSGTVFKLIGVHINGDLIDANTLKADRILLRNSTDGLYYELNTHGGAITPSGYTEEQLKNGILGAEIVAHSVTADQLTVNNIVGTGGWINLAQGTFNYQSLATGGGISWDGQHLVINADVVTFGPTRRNIEDVDEAVQGAVDMAQSVLDRADAGEFKGDMGPTGPQGEQGPQGLQGPQGIPGQDGADGKDGAKGEKGETGPQGPKGDTGPQGVQGVKGDDGITYYTWIKYADTPTSGMSDNPTGKAYVGIAYNKTTATESTRYADYNWSLIKGEKGDTGDQGPQGIQGEPGADGEKGEKGDTGNTGATGNGIGSIEYRYKTTTTQTAPDASAITSTTMPPLSDTNKYLWQKEVIHYTNGTNQTTVLLLAVYGDKGAQGPQGVQGIKGDTGAQGPQGISLSSTTRYYQLSVNEPQKPSDGQPIPSDWSNVEPEYTPGDTKNLYLCDQSVWSDGSITYSQVSLSSTYAATKQLGVDIKKEVDEIDETVNGIKTYTTNGTNVVYLDDNGYYYYSGDERIDVSPNDLLDDDGVPCGVSGGVPSINMEGGQENTINYIIDSLNDTADKLWGDDGLSKALAQELVASNHASVDANGITIKGKFTLGGEEIETKLVLSSASISMLVGSSNALTIDSTTQGEGLLSCLSAQHATLRFKSGGGEGNFGWVAQTNGHISLKEVR